MMTLRWIAIALIVVLISARAACVLRGKPPDPPPTEPTLNRPLPQELWKKLEASDWRERVGEELGLWVSVARQRLIGIRRGRVEFILVCSTALRGVGNREGSNQTPAGWHEIDERIGDDAPPGAIFVERKFVGKVWTPETPTQKDHVLTRVLWLSGLEPGLNAGPGIDSHDRFIYIHGTPTEDKLGTPASMGCVRLSNADVVALFDRTTSGTPVLITEW